MLMDCRRRVLAFDVLNLGTAISKPLQLEPFPKVEILEKLLILVILTKTGIFVKINY
jgi:hypothetical protein